MAERKSDDYAAKMKTLLLTAIAALAAAVLLYTVVAIVLSLE